MRKTPTVDDSETSGFTGKKCSWGTEQKESFWQLAMWLKQWHLYSFASGFYISLKEEKLLGEFTIIKMSDQPPAAKSNTREALDVLKRKKM